VICPLSTIYDFGYSLIYPPETNLEDVRENRFLNFGLRRLPEPLGPHNPFKEDVAFLGVILQRWVRHIENIVPEIGPSFEGMVHKDYEKRLTIHQALEEFERICSCLTATQMNQTVTTRHWKGNVI